MKSESFVVQVLEMSHQRLEGHQTPLTVNQKVSELLIQFLVQILLPVLPSMLDFLYLLAYEPNRERDKQP